MLVKIILLKLSQEGVEISAQCTKPLTIIVGGHHVNNYKRIFKEKTEVVTFSWFSKKVLRGLGMRTRPPSFIVILLDDTLLVVQLSYKKCYGRLDGLLLGIIT